MQQDNIYSTQKKTDSQFFFQLSKYKPLFYSGKGTPFLLMNQNWSSSLFCLGSMNVIAAVLLILFIINSNKYSQNKRESDMSPILVIALSIILILLANLSFIMTQLANPGIRNPSSISEESFSIHGRQYCKYCREKVLSTMTHCRDCEVCIQDLDHHCGFFNKCIAGWQKFWFYAVLTFGFLGFVDFMVLGSYLLM